jgi:hypothetical protein
MVYWTGAALLSYAAYGYRPVYEPTTVLLLEYVPIYGLLALELKRRAPLLSAFLERKTQEDVTPSPGELSGSDRQLRSRLP